MFLIGILCNTQVGTQFVLLFYAAGKIDVSSRIFLWGYEPDFERAICYVENSNCLLLLLLLLLIFMHVFSTSLQEEEQETQIFSTWDCFSCLLPLSVPFLSWDGFWPWWDLWGFFSHCFMHKPISSIFSIRFVASSSRYALEQLDSGSFNPLIILSDLSAMSIGPWGQTALKTATIMQEWGAKLSKDKTRREHKILCNCPSFPPKSVLTKADMTMGVNREHTNALLLG